jgi:hypothetical protein
MIDLIQHSMQGGIFMAEMGISIPTKTKIFDECPMNTQGIRSVLSHDTSIFI